MPLPNCLCLIPFPLFRLCDLFVGLGEDMTELLLSSVYLTEVLDWFFLPNGVFLAVSFQNSIDFKN